MRLYPEGDFASSLGSLSAEKLQALGAETCLACWSPAWGLTPSSLSCTTLLPRASSAGARDPPGFPQDLPLFSCNHFRGICAPKSHPRGHGLFAMSQC